MTPESAFKLIMAVIGVLLSVGFITGVFKVGYGIRGWVEAERKRAETEEKVVVMLGDFITTQREFNGSISRVIRQQGVDIRELRDHAFGRTQGEQIEAS